MDNLIKFIKENYYYTDEDIYKLISYIPEHFKYNTIIIIELNGQIIAFARWNIDHDNAKILEAIIDKRYQKYGLLKLMVKRGHEMFPYVNTISFVREHKYKDRQERKYDIKQFIGE